MENFGSIFAFDYEKVKKKFWNNLDPWDIFSKKFVQYGEHENLWSSPFYLLLKKRLSKGDFFPSER